MSTSPKDKYAGLTAEIFDDLLTELLSKQFSLIPACGDAWTALMEEYHNDVLDMYTVRYGEEEAN